MNWLAPGHQVYGEALEREEHRRLRFRICHSGLGIHGPQEKPGAPPPAPSTVITSDMMIRSFPRFFGAAAVRVVLRAMYRTR